MLYSALSQQFAPPPPSIFNFFNDPSRLHHKNTTLPLGNTLHLIHRRKISRRQSHEQHKSFKQQFYHNCSTNKSPAKQKSGEDFKPNMTIGEQLRHKSKKRSTLNNQYPIQIQQPTQKPINHHSRNTKSFIVTTKDFPRQKIQEKKQSSQKQQIISVSETGPDQSQGQFLLPKSYARKFSTKLNSIDNDVIIPKSSLVDLIKKYKFENLKTNNDDSTSQKWMKYSKKQHQFFTKKKEPLKESECNELRRKTRMKWSTQGAKKNNIQKGGERRLTRKESTLKRVTSMMSPWGSVTQQYFLINSPK